MRFSRIWYATTLCGAFFTPALARQDIADEIGCDVSTITKHYNGTRNITTDFIETASIPDTVCILYYDYFSLNKKSGVE